MKRSRPEKLTKEDKYFTEMLDKERKYRAKTGGDDCDEPIMVPLLFGIRSTLSIILRLLAFLFGMQLTRLLIGR